MDEAKQTVTRPVAIKKYFYKDTDSATAVLKEYKELTPEDRQELAEGAAKELGLELVEA